MRGAALFLFLLAAIGLAPTARAQEGLAGQYVAEMRETATALELSPDGRFRWAYIQGSRDMFAEGRWRAAQGGGVLLTTEPPAEPPEVTLIGAGRHDQPGLAVRVTGPDEQDLPYAQFLTVEGETPSGEWIEGSFAHDTSTHEFRDLDGPVTVVAVRIAIPAYRFRSARFAMPAGASLIRLGFAANGLARGDFRETRLNPEGDGLNLTLFDEPIRYRRLAGDEADAATAIIDDIAAEMGIVVPLEGPVEIGIGEALDRRLSRGLAYEGMRRVTPGQIPVDLSVRMAGRTVDFGRVGGPGLLVLSVDLAGWPSTVDAVSFGYQDRPLLLAEAIERGRALERLLRDAGFAEATDLPPGWTPQAPFEAVADEGDAARPTRPVRADDWDGAARLLAEAERAIGSMRLFVLQAPGVFASVTLDNFRLIAGRDGVPIGPEYATGRDWLLSVTIHRDPRTIPPIVSR